jgi:MinD-like ATPase involved in chromosome partitioning or flagellar assembly
VTNILNLSEKIESHLCQQLQIQDSDATVSVRKTSLDWLKVRVVTNYFEGKTLAEREENIDNLLESIELNLGQYPISNYSLLTPAEEAEQPEESIQLPLWSDVLMAPEPLHRASASIDKDTPKRPQIVTFYSFKGGVGRSTALGIVAILLANRNRRVAVVDFDLEAPGISILLQSDENISDTNGAKNYGVLDYLHQRHLTPEENIPAIEDCIRQIDLPGRGELFLVSAGEYDENYIHRLAELDRRTWQSFYRGAENPVEQLITDIKKQIDPDVILIDARPGFNDTGAVALLDLADTGIICFSPTDQSFDGLRWVIQSARKQSDYKGKPDLRFLLTPMPIVAEDQLYAWINKAENWIEDNWGLPDDVNIKEIYYKVSYNPNIAVLSNLINAPINLLNDYLLIADAIDASLPDIKPIVPIATQENQGNILHQLRFEAARAQDLQADIIPTIFQRTEDFPRFLSNRIWLIRGAKGTGKSLLFRLFVEQPNKARELARGDVDLTNCQFIAAHGEQRLKISILSSENLASYEKEIGNDNWSIFWLNYILLQLCVSYPDLLSIPDLDEELVKLSSDNDLRQTSIISWLVKRTQSAQAIPQASDELRSIDRWLDERNKSVWLLYDELDAGFGFGEDSYDRRRRALEALLAWWLESGMSLKRIIPKIFLREDIWNQLNFVNKGHYSTGKSMRLRWDETDLWRLVLRQALQSSSSLRQILEQEFGVTVDRLETLDLVQLRKSLYPLWGERMGSGKKAYTYNWIRTRIADSNDNCFPRSLILLLEEATRQEKNFSTEYKPNIVLRPKALIDAFPYVSKQRVEEVRNEYPELKTPLDQLQNERSPIDENRLTEIWNTQDNVVQLIKEMLDAGILKERSRPKDPPPRVYAVAELYLYGLGMVRKGQR